MTNEMSLKAIAAILAHREVPPLLSDDHLSVEGTLVSQTVAYGYYVHDTDQKTCRYFLII
jgi:hypothetical protein